MEIIVTLINVTSKKTSLQRTCVLLSVYFVFLVYYNSKFNNNNYKESTHKKLCFFTSLKQKPVQVQIISQIFFELRRTVSMYSKHYKYTYRPFHAF